jgi:ribosome maturation factor RimP
MRGCEKMASKKDIESIAEKLLEPILKANNFECVDIEFIQEAGNWFLRVYLDKEEGITINDCELVSRALEKELDKKDPIKDPYILEVSSPGLDRPLKKDKDFERHIGEHVEIRLYKAVNKSKDVTGILLAFDEDTITVEIEHEETIFLRKDIAIIRLAIIF